MRMRSLVVWAVLALSLLPAACGGSGAPAETERFAPAGMRSVLETPQDDMDCELSVGEDGTLTAEVDGPGRLRLFRVGNPPSGEGRSLEDCIVTFRAEVATQGLATQCHLELLCRFPDQGTYFSRDLGHKLSGDTDWTALSAPFLLDKGQRPDSFILNLVFEGTGQGRVLVRGARLVQSAPDRPGSGS